MAECIKTQEQYRLGRRILRPVSVRGTAVDEFRWSARISATGRQRALVYIRKHQFEIGAPVQFDPEYPRITVLEYVLGAVGADIINGLNSVARSRRVVI